MEANKNVSGIYIPLFVAGEDLQKCDYFYKQDN